MNSVFGVLHRLSNVILCGLLLMCTGCASLSTYHNRDRIPDGRAQAVFVDAKQRALLTAPVEGKDGRILRFCAEPSPDVFTAISSSFGLSAVTGRDKTRNDISAELQQALSENAAAIGRTQTLNVLREMMYRNCERYLSGAITDQEFIVQAARDQRAIVHVLAIEQLTGAARTQAIALTTAASAALSGGGEEVMKTLKAAYDEKKVLADEADKARKKANAHAPAVACESGKDAYASTSPDDRAKISDKNKLCAEADQADVKAKEAADHYAEQKKLADRTGTLNTQANGSAKELKEEAGKAAAELAQAVKEIVIANNDFNEVGMTCVVLFRNFANGDTSKKDANSNSVIASTKAGGSKNDNEAFVENCMRYLIAMVTREEKKVMRDAARYELDAARYERSETAIRGLVNASRARSRPLAEIVWNHIVSNGRPDPKKLDDLLNRASIDLLDFRIDDMISAADLVEFNMAFSGLAPKDQRALSEAASPASDIPSK